MKSAAKVFSRRLIVFNRAPKPGVSRFLNAETADSRTPRPNAQSGGKTLIALRAAGVKTGFLRPRWREIGIRRAFRRARRRRRRG